MIHFLITGVATGALNYAVTPILIKEYKENKLRALNNLANSIFNALLFFFVLFCLVQIVFANQIVGILVPGFSVDIFELTVNLFRIHAVISIFSILTALVVSLEYTFGRMYNTITIPILSIIIQTIFVYLFHAEIGIYSVVISLFLFNISNLILLGFKYLKSYKFKIQIDDKFRVSFRNIYPLIISSSFSKSNVIVDRYFASQLSAGSITYLQYSLKIIQVVSELVNKGISLVTLRSFSFSSEDTNKFDKKFIFSLKAIIFIVIPVVFLVVLFMDEMLNVILITDKINQEDLVIIYNTIIAFLGVFVGGSMLSVITNSFYAKGLTNIVSITNVVVQVLGIALKIVLFIYYKYWGLAFGFSITSIINTIIFIILYNKYVSNLSYLYLSKYIVKIFILAFIAYLSFYLLSFILPEFWLFKSFIGALIFVLSFLIYSLIFEREISRLMLSKINYGNIFKRN